MADHLSQSERRDEAGLRPGQRVKSHAAANEPGRFLLGGLIVSLLVHVGIAALAFDHPVGRYDPALIQQSRRTVYFEPAPSNASSQFLPGRSDGDEKSEPTPTSSELSKAMLAEAKPPELASRRFKLAMRQVNEPLPRLAPRQLEVALPPFKLEGEGLSELDEEPPQSPTSPGPQRGESGNTPRDAAGAGGGKAGSAASTAQRLLAQAGMTPTARATGSGGTGGGEGGGGGTTVPTPVRDRAPLDTRLMDVGLDSPPIDFTGVADRASTQLDVPEHLDRDFNYYVSRFDPEGGRYGKKGYFRVDIVAQQSLSKLDALGKDVVFLIDTSASVPQPWVEQVIAGVRKSLWRLNGGDRFNLVLFDENPSFFNPRHAVEATPGRIQKAVRWLEQAHPQGFTDVNAALSRLLKRDLASNRVYDLILISDGRPTRGVKDTRELINLITRDNSAASIYTVGVGNRVNRALLDFLSYRNRGFSIFADQRERADETIQQLMSRLRYPLIKRVGLNLAGAAIQQVYPRNLPNIHQGERFSIYGRYTRPSPFTVRVTGVSGDQKVDFTFTRDLSMAPPGEKRIAVRWAFRKLHHLYSEMIRTGDSKTLRDGIRRLRRVYDLRTLYE